MGMKCSVSLLLHRETGFSTLSTAETTANVKKHFYTHPYVLVNNMHVCRRTHTHGLCKPLRKSLRDNASVKSDKTMRQEAPGGGGSGGKTSQSNNLDNENNKNSQSITMGTQAAKAKLST